MANTRKNLAGLLTGKSAFKGALLSFVLGAVAPPVAAMVTQSGTAHAGSWEHTVLGDPQRCRKPAGNCWRFLTPTQPSQTEIDRYLAACYDVVWEDSAGVHHFWGANCPEASAAGQDIGL